MALADDLRELRDRVHLDLIKAHDYYAETKLAWRIVEESIERGRTLSTRNRITGTVTTAAELAANSKRYVTEQLAEATFQQFISIFENFFLDFLRLWLTEYPKSLGKRTVDFKTILDLPDKDAITYFVVTKELNEVLYDRPTEWFAYLEERANLGCPTPDEIAQVAEAKASRDVLVHNKGFANKIYRSKAGHLARYREGDKIEITEPYHRETWALIRKVVTDLSNAAIRKAA